MAIDSVTSRPVHLQGVSVPDDATTPAATGTTTTRAVTVDMDSFLSSEIGQALLQGGASAETLASVKRAVSTTGLETLIAKMGEVKGDLAFVGDVDIKVDGELLRVDAKELGALIDGLGAMLQSGDAALQTKAMAVLNGLGKAIHVANDADAAALFGSLAGEARGALQAAVSFAAAPGVPPSQSGLLLAGQSIADASKLMGQVDVNALVQWVLRESYLETTESLRDYANKVQFYNELKKSIRAELEGRRSDLAKYAGKPDDTPIEPALYEKNFDGYEYTGSSNLTEPGAGETDGSATNKTGPKTPDVKTPTVSPELQAMATKYEADVKAATTTSVTLPKFSDPGMSRTSVTSYCNDYGAKLVDYYRGLSPEQKEAFEQKLRADGLSLNLISKETDWANDSGSRVHNAPKLGAGEDVETYLRSIVNDAAGKFDMEGNDGDVMSQFDINIPGLTEGTMFTVAVKNEVEMPAELTAAGYVLGQGFPAVSADLVKMAQDYEAELAAAPEKTVTVPKFDDAGMERKDLTTYLSEYGDKLVQYYRSLSPDEKAAFEKKLEADGLRMDCIAKETDWADAQKQNSYSSAKLEPGADVEAYLRQIVTDAASSFASKGNDDDPMSQFDLNIPGLTTGELFSASIPDTSGITMPQELAAAGYVAGEGFPKFIDTSGQLVTTGGTNDTAAKEARLRELAKKYEADLGAAPKKSVDLPKFSDPGMQRTSSATYANDYGASLEAYYDGLTPVQKEAFEEKLKADGLTMVCKGKETDWSDSEKSANFTSRKLKDGEDVGDYLREICNAAAGTFPTVGNDDDPMSQFDINIPGLTEGTLFKVDIADKSAVTMPQELVDARYVAGKGFPAGTFTVGGGSSGGPVTNSDWVDATDTGQKRIETKADLETYIKNLESKLNTVGDDAQLANVDLQNWLQKQQQTLQMLSNISKMLHDTAMAVIRKIGG